MPNLHGSFVWYELITPDPNSSKTFYDSVVGWTIADRSSFPSGYRLIGRSDGKQAGGLLPLTEEMKAHGARPVWLGYVGVDDVDSALAGIESRGGKALMPAFDIPNVGRVAMIADPQGAPIYIMKPQPRAGDGDGDGDGDGEMVSDVFSVDQPQHVRWNELSTTDSAGAIAFYAGNFGWKQEGEMDMGEMGKYQFLHHGGMMIGAVMPKMPQTPVSMWTYYIGVDDIDRAAGAVRDGGGQILQEPIEIPGGEYSLVGVDPQGAAFGLVGPRK